jgi:Cft2 family RNA processing exonuclease
MDIRFLGAANTVTGSQFLLTTDRAKVLIDCGMFQGSPHEIVRNRVPISYDPGALDAIVLTHAHLDHCGLIPHVVAQGFHGPIYATQGTMELATLVLLDSGKLQEEYAKRQNKWAARHPEKALLEQAKDRAALAEQERIAALADAAAMAAASGAPVAPVAAEAGPLHAGQLTPDGHVIASGIDELALRDEQGVGTRMGYPPVGHPNHDAAMTGAPVNPNLVLEEPLYDTDQAEAALTQFRPVRYETAVQVAPGITAVYHDAGHILGSAIVELRVEAQGSTSARTLVFSGDLGRYHAPILRDPAIVTNADYVFVESTYGGRTHEPEAESLDDLAKAVRDTAGKGGVLLIPAFAIGRTQEVVWALRHLLDSGKIPPIKLYLDSPMASKASTIYRSHTDYFDPETLRLLDQGEGPVDFPNAQETPTGQQSEQIERAKRPYVVVASNGMLTGGRVLNHLRDLVGDSKATILFVGYQGEGTLGARLQAGAKIVKLEGQDFQVRCGIRSISGFSAHADEPQILAWLGHFIEGRKAGDPGVPRKIFVVHGDPDAQQALEPKIAALGLTPDAPRWHEHVTLD